MIEANNPDLHSWIHVAADSDFPIQNLPFGVFKTDKSSPRAGTIIGDTVIDLHQLHRFGYLQDLDLPDQIFERPYLNDLMALGKPTARKLRNRLSEIFALPGQPLPMGHMIKVLRPVTDVTMCMPVKIGDYTDFYSSEYHAYNVGVMFRDPDNALLPNWKHIPVGYHGRASSIVISGTPIRRPKGQTKEDTDKQPNFGPTKRLDFELEMAFVTCGQTALGETISMEQAEDHIFGLVIFNDWSARDMQKWEYVPLGPFLAKSFGSSISPWIVTLDALEPFKVPGPKQDPAVLPYLQADAQFNYDIQLEVALRPEGGEEEVISKSNFKYMYWNMNQQLTHHASNGCNINVGDMMASGTISGPTPDSYGSMLELAWKGTKPIKLSDGTERKFIADGDTVTMYGHGEKAGVRIGFGAVSTQILPSN